MPTCIRGYANARPWRHVWGGERRRRGCPGRRLSPADAAMLDAAESRGILKFNRRARPSNRGQKAMSLRSKTDFLRRLAGGALVATALLTASPAYAQGTAAGPFEALAGTWSGNGAVNTSDGLHERVRCTAKYVSQNSGHSVRLDLLCASDSYKVEFSSSIVQK